jgi:hypothetical protein
MRARCDSTTRFRIPLQTQQLGSHLFCDLIPQFPVFLHCPVDDVFEFRGQVKDNSLDVFRLWNLEKVNVDSLARALVPAHDTFSEASRD